jgi:hypothetical protein
MTPAHIGSIARLSMLDQASYAAKHRAALEGRLSRVRLRIEELRQNPARAAALRAAEIERQHIEREIEVLTR